MCWIGRCESERLILWDVSFGEMGWVLVAGKLDTK